MDSFFVLGKIPGTEITITFSMWVQAGLILLALYLLIKVHRRNTSNEQTQLSPTIAND